MATQEELRQRRFYITVGTSLGWFVLGAHLSLWMFGEGYGWVGAIIGGTIGYLVAQKVLNEV